jgi:hypothetical protein
MEPHHFGGAGARAVTQRGSGSKLNGLHKWIIKNVTKGNSFLLFLFTFVITNVAEPEPEPHLLVGVGAITQCGSGSGFDGSGFDGSGFDGSGFDGSGFDGSGFENGIKHG